MKTRPRLTVCAAITADGKLDPVPASVGDFGTAPDGGVFTLADHNDPAGLRELFVGGQVDEIRLMIRPTIDGRRHAPTLGGEPGEYFSSAVRCRLLKMEVRAGECLLHYRVLKTRARSAPGVAD